MDIKMQISVGINDEKQASGFKVQEIYFGDMHKILNSNVAYSPSMFKYGHRKAKNFLGGNTFISLDFDEGLSIEEAKKEFSKYINLIVTTRHHQKEKVTDNGKVKPACDRFRVILPVLYPINLCAEDFKKLMMCFVHSYGIDPASTDSSRFYYGNPDGLYWYNWDGDFFYWPILDYKSSPKVVKKVNAISQKREANHLLIIDRCKAMNYFVNNQDSISYNLWFNGLNVLAFCNDGENLCHEYSALDQRQYKPRQVQGIYDTTQKLSGAAHCNNFAMEVPCLCKECPFCGLINSPISLGREKPYVKTDIVITQKEFIKRLQRNPILAESYNNRELTFTEKFLFQDDSATIQPGNYATREEATSDRTKCWLEHAGVVSDEF